MSAVLLRWALRLFLLFVVGDLVYLASVWPDWQRIAHGPVPETRFIRHYVSVRAAHHWPRLRWKPVPLWEIPKTVQRAVIVAEDSRFWQEKDGFDFPAIRDAFLYNLRKGHIVYGASTITQQTAKNLFLTPSRNFLRKGNEALLTWILVHHLSKSRILEIYLDTAQFGRGIYGVEAASRAYWGLSVTQLSLAQAAALAASLPSPVDNNPAHQGRFFVHHYRKIFGQLTLLYQARQPVAASAPSGQTAVVPAGPVAASAPSGQTAVVPAGPVAAGAPATGVPSGQTAPVPVSVHPQ